jgi:hypothetical protein
MIRALVNFEFRHEHAAEPILRDHAFDSVGDQLLGCDARTSATVRNFSPPFQPE